MKTKDIDIILNSQAPGGEGGSKEVGNIMPIKEDFKGVNLGFLDDVYEQTLFTSEATTPFS